MFAAFCALLTAMAVTDTRQHIFDSGFRSLQVRVNGRQISFPIINLNTSDRVEIVFDEIAYDHRYLRYELVHCNSRWQPEGLADSEFLEGFNQGDVTDYDFSRSTLVHYVNYRIVLPNDQMQFKVSGNYLVRVYPEDDPDVTLLQARFSVSENIMGIEGGVTSRTDIDTNGRHQQLEFAVDTRENRVDNIFEDLDIVVTRNAEPESEVALSHPLRVQGGKAVYEHLRPLIFKGGNEYRRFEAITTRFPGIGIAALEYHDPMYHYILNVDEPRASRRYQYDSTQHGRFFIREYDSADGDTEADYVVGHFTLRMPRLRNGEVYVDGYFTRDSDQTPMVYNDAEGAYEKSFMLKQGAYNYRYVIKSADSQQADSSPIEGDFHETSNEYLVKVYHRPRGSRYDRLVTATSLYSLP